MPKFQLFLLSALAFGQPAAFDATVAPLLRSKCVPCHGAAPQAKLDLRTEEAALKGGASGPSIVPGNAAKSFLLDKVVTGQMPPGKVKLTSDEVDILRTWIDKMKAPAAESVSEFEIRGILQARCIVCHGAGKKEGGLDLRTVASRLKGGKSGPALVPGKPEESLMYKRIADGQMPPEKPAKDLAVELPTPSETEKIRAWIAAGAPSTASTPAMTAAVTDKDREFWSFQPPKRPAVPAVKNGAIARNPIDRFLLAKLEAKGLGFSPEADKLTLLRRAHLDLTGIPPTPAEIRDYLVSVAKYISGAYAVSYEQNRRRTQSHHPKT